MTDIIKILLEEKEMKLKGRLYHYTQINFAYNSNHIEGSSLTEDETRYIYETNSLLSSGEKAIPIDDITETKNHFKCFDYILESISEPLSEKIIKELHKILKSNTSDSEKEWFAIGDYKRRRNFIGDNKTTSPDKVQKEIRELLENYNENKEKKSLETLADFHYKFEKIHPFQDGNGRVGRLILFRECLKNDIIPFVIDESHRAFYYRGLKNYEQEKGWLIDTLLSCQDKYKDILKQLGITNSWVNKIENMKLNKENKSWDSKNKQSKGFGIDE